jgi:hypothetical protein
MARNTFQGLMRTTCGRPGSVPDRASNPPGLPANIARMTLRGVIQCRGVNIGATDLVIGMLPAGFLVTGTIGVAAPSGGTVAIILPAYRGLPQVTLRAAAAVVPGGETPVAPAVTYGIDRPIVMRGVAATLGQAIVGIEGFPLDDAAVAGD